MQKSFVLVIMLASTLTLAASTVALAQSDPVALLEKHDDAINRGDVAGALALYADDAVIDGGGLCQAAPCVGKAAIQKELERRVASHPSRTFLQQYVSGNVVTSRAEVRNDMVKQAGLERVIGWVITVIQGEKIAYVHGGEGGRSGPQAAPLFGEGAATPPTHACPAPGRSPPRPF